MSNELIVTSRIRDYVKGHMKKLGTKQAFLAQEMGYEPKNFSLLINGRRLMKIDDLVILCSYFKVPATTFIPFEKENKDAS